MLRFHNYDIVFQEIPYEVTLAINISGCPNRCKGCHSPHLWNDIGKVLDESSIAVLMEKYGNALPVFVLWAEIPSQTKWIDWLFIYEDQLNSL